MAIMAIAIHATNKISLSSAVGQPTEEVQVDVLLENSDDIAAIEIKIPLDENMTYVDGSIEMNSARSNGHAISAGEVDKELRIYIYSFSLNSIVGNDGKLCSFKLKLKREPAVYNLQPNVVLSSATGSAIMAETVAGSVTISAPKLEIETKNIDFGHIPIRSSYEQSVVLRNVGTSVLSVSSVTIDDTDFAFNETAFDMAPGDSKYLTLQYAPVNWGAISRTITVVSDAMNGKQTASVVADPFSVNELHVAQVSGIADSIVAVPITMNNMEPIVAAQFSFKLPEALVYEGVEMSARATNHVAMGSMSGDTLMVMIYSPTNEALSGVDGEICRVKLRLDGRSGWYYLEPTDVILGNASSINMISAVYGEYVVIQSPEMTSDDNLTFETSPITENARGEYSIYNGGQAPLIIERVAFLAEGYRVTTQLPLVVEAYNSSSFVVEYTPTKEGKYSTTMQVYTNDPDNRMKSVAVSGEIYEPNSLSLSGAKVDDGYEVRVAMDNYSDIVAMQFDIHWLAGMATDASLMKTTSRMSGHTCSVTKIGDGFYRVVAFSLTNASVVGEKPPST